MRIKQVLRLLAPYIAVGIFWCGLSNAWLAILAYHAQIVFWLCIDRPDFQWGVNKRALILAIPTLVAGPLLYFLLPYITRVELSVWLSKYQLCGLSFILMIPYFGIIHPFLEQLHWARLRDETPLSHFMFAGYHVLVLYSLLTLPWVLFCFAVLVASSFLWRYLTNKHKSLVLPILSHILADFSLIIAVWYW